MWHHCPGAGSICTKAITGMMGMKRIKEACDEAANRFSARGPIAGERKPCGGARGGAERGSAGAGERRGDASAYRGADARTEGGGPTTSSPRAAGGAARAAASVLSDGGAAGNGDASSRANSGGDAAISETGEFAAGGFRAHLSTGRTGADGRSEQSDADSNAGSNRSGARTRTAIGDVSESGGGIYRRRNSRRVVWRR